MVWNGLRSLLKFTHGITVRVTGTLFQGSRRFSSSSMERPTVELGPGTRVQGKVLYANSDHTPVYTYLGIPFAEPPIGKLRFKPPQPVHLWDGTRDATQFGAICPQPLEAAKLAFQRYPIPEKMSEDCLFLNVFTPVRQESDLPPGVKGHRLPVMFWIHGGGFLLGSSDIYDGRAFASNHEVIVVTINYRLGILGYLSTPDGHIQGNMGQLDQIEALRWVHRHIHRFGGDPDNVTVFGESAGSISVSLHMLSPLTKGLFRRGICESGTALYNGVMWSKENASKFLRHTLKLQGYRGSMSGPAIEAYLNTLSTQDITERFFKQFGMVVDGHYMPSHPVELYRAGRFHDVDLMCGFNTHEGMLFINMFIGPTSVQTRDDAEGFINMSLKTVQFRGAPQADEICSRVRDVYLRDCSEKDDEYLRKCVEVQADCQFTAPTNMAAQLHSERRKTFMYEFCHRPFFSKLQSWAVSDHTDEIPYVFGEPFITNRPWPNTDTAVSKQLMTYWANFAKKGDPNGHTVPDWPAFNMDTKKYNVISDATVTEQNYKPSKMSLWNNTIMEMMSDNRPKL